jgi:hypothetical protein
LYDDAYSRSVALTTWHPDGMAGRVNRTTARALLPLLVSTLSTESVP